MEVLTLGPDATLAQVQQLVTEQRHAMGLDAMPVAMHADVVCADTGQAVQWLQDHANGMVLPAVLYHDEAMRPEPMDDAALDERLRGLRAKLRARDRAWWKTHKPANGMVECPSAGPCSMWSIAGCVAAGGTGARSAMGMFVPNRWPANSTSGNTSTNGCGTCATASCRCRRTRCVGWWPYPCGNRPQCASHPNDRCPWQARGAVLVLGRYGDA